MTEQAKVNQVTAAVLAAMPDRIMEVQRVDPDWEPGDVLLNLTTGERMHLRWADPDEKVVAVAPEPLRG